MAKETKDAIGIEIFPLAKFVENNGNPRKKAEDTSQMVDSLLIFPKMLSVRPLAYTKTEDKLLVLGGNYRLRGLNEIAGYTLDIIKERLSGMIGWEKKSSKEQAALLTFWKKWLAEPVAYGICLDGMTVEEKKEFIIKDNLSYGQWDEEALRGWNREAVKEWGLDGIKWNDDKLPDELDGVDLEPDDLPLEEGEGSLLYQRVIITFKESERKLVAQLLKHPVDKVVFNIKELL